MSISEDSIRSVVDLGGGDGGDASPPTSLKVTILAEKSASVSNKSAPFRDASPPTDLKVTNPAKNQSQFWWRPFFFFFFFFFLETTWIWAKKTFEFPISAEKLVSILVKTFFFFFFFFWRPSEFGRKKRLNLRFRPKNQSQFWWRHPNFWGFVLQIPPHQNFLDPPLHTFNSLIHKFSLFLLWKISESHQKAIFRFKFCFTCSWLCSLLKLLLTLHHILQCLY